MVSAAEMMSMMTSVAMTMGRVVTMPVVMCVMKMCERRKRWRKKSPVVAMMREEIVHPTLLPMLPTLQCTNVCFGM